MIDLIGSFVSESIIGIDKTEEKLSEARDVKNVIFGPTGSIGNSFRRRSEFETDKGEYCKANEEPFK